jgi:hypothetical protein
MDCQFHSLKNHVVLFLSTVSPFSSIVHWKFHATNGNLGLLWLSQVRVYTAEHVHEELGFAVHGYARAAVGISVKGKLLIPKLLYCHAHETVEDRVLLDWVCNFLPTAQVALIFECIQQRRYNLLQSNNFAVLPFDFSFRYLFPSEICN